MMHFYNTVVYKTGTTTTLKLICDSPYILKNFCQQFL